MDIRIDGFEVKGIDLRRPLTERQGAALREAFCELGVLVFRDQPIDDEQQVAFSRTFGELEPTSFAQAAAHPCVYSLSNVDEEGSVLPPDARKRVFLEVNTRWHSDSSFKPVPAAASILSARVVPTREPANTAFASMRRGWERLAETRRRELRSLTAVHSYAWSLGHFCRVGDEAGVTQEELDALPPVSHPLVRVHPEGGWETLYVSGHIERIEGMEPEAGRRLAAELIDWCTRPEDVYEHEWQPHDVVMWDNRSMLHRATRIPLDEPRIMHRTTVVGSVPVRPALAA